jgi:hypothetical protein
MFFYRRCAALQTPCAFFKCTAQLNFLSLWERAGVSVSILLSAFAAIALFCATTANAVTVSLSNIRSGSTPEIVGYNSGHFMPGSNTADWWRYSGVNGARVWPTPTTVEASDDLGPWGDGVSSQATFVARRFNLRAGNNPLSSTYINWSYFNSRYANNPTSTNSINLNYAFGQLQSMHIDPVVEISYTNSSFAWDPAGTAAGWADRWEQWQHFYAQAFYLAEHYDVHRFEMYNEPNNDDIPAAEWLERLQISSDAVQSAIADVNRLFGKSLKAEVQAPVTAGNPVSYYPTWGRPAMQQLHANPLGVADPFQLFDTYDYQRYDQTPDTFGSELTSVKNLVNADAGGTPMRFAISEFNVHTASYFDSHPAENLDAPADFSRFGSILAQLTNNKPDELYVFKFSQTPGSSGPVKLNGTHFVDNGNAPYNIGGATKGAEVVRLYAKGFAGAKDLLNVPTFSGTGATSFRTAASRDNQQNKYSLLSSNEGTSAQTLTLDLTSWGIAPGARAIIEEVSADRQGEVTQIITVPSNRIINVAQSAQSVVLVSVPKLAPTYVTTLNATDDAMVKAGANANSNFGSSVNLFAKNDTTDPAARNVSFIKFNTGSIVTSEVRQAVLQLWGQNTGSASQVITHVYGITNDNWKESTITWNTAPNLSTSTSTNTAINDISENFITGIGSTAHIVGELTGVAAGRLMSIDVSDFVRGHPDQQLSFLVTREVRWDGENVDDALTSLQMASKERGTDPGPQLFLTLGAGALPGDYNHDGAVTTADYSIWREDYSTANPSGDANQSGNVDAIDYVMWRKNVGSSLPGGPPAAAIAAAVPEPNTGLLSVLAAAFAAFFPRRLSRACYAVNQHRHHGVRARA